MNLRNSSDPKLAGQAERGWPAIEAKLDRRAHGVKPTRQAMDHADREKRERRAFQRELAAIIGGKE